MKIFTFYYKSLY